MEKTLNADCTLLSGCKYRKQNCYDCQFSRSFRREENILRWALCPYYNVCSMNKDTCYSCYKYLKGVRKNEKN